MIFNYSRLAIIFCILSASCAPSKIHTLATDVLPATALKPYGRFAFNKTGDLELISSAVHFGIRFKGTECRIYATIPNAEGHNYLQYELDGTYQKRIRISGKSEQPIVIKVKKSGTHTIWIYKATEAHSGAISIQKIIAENIMPLQNSEAPCIEFIGNSITCGAAADTSEVPCGKGDYLDQHNAYYAYGPRVARALGTNFILSSVSGIGIYRNWNSDGPTMPQVYEKTDFQESSPQAWDFEKVTPRIVCIALGTNDFSKGDGIKKRDPFDSSAFVSNYIKFIESIKKKYPQAQIALVSSPMVSGASRLTLQNCITAVKENVDAFHTSEKPIALYFFQPMQAHGCSGHPSVADHAMLATELMPFFKQLLQ